MIIVHNDSIAQSENSTGWKNYTNNYFNLTLEIPTSWKVTDETSRFYEDKNLYFDHDKRFDYNTFARTGIWPIDTSDAKQYVEDEEEYILSNNDGNKIRLIEDIQENKYNIGSVPSYSYLYLESSEGNDYAMEVTTFIHNGQGYKLFTMVTPPNYFDDALYSEDLRRMINSIKLSDSNTPSRIIL